MTNARELVDTYWERLFDTDDAEWTAHEFFVDAHYQMLLDLAVMPQNQTSRTATNIAQMALSIIEDDIEGFTETLLSTTWKEREYAEDATYCNVVLCGLLYATANGDDRAANYLGALHYLGNVIDVDYGRAKALYEVAERAGNIRAMINLGYIYEYGRLGEPDFLAAYFQYTKACALSDDVEALYKLGDMYARAQVVPQDLTCAFRLYERSLGAAEGEIQQAQAAFRIAELIADPKNVRWGIPFDPMGALSLYQLAERGLRRDIAHGQVYYAQRLEQALEGQRRMRELLDEGVVEI